jgi:hypothetical protein
MGPGLGRPTLAKMRRDAFSPEEYRKLHTVASL